MAANELLPISPTADEVLIESINLYKCTCHGGALTCVAFPLSFTCYEGAYVCTLTHNTINEPGSVTELWQHKSKTYHMLTKCIVVIIAV